MLSEPDWFVLKIPVLCYEPNPPWGETIGSLKPAGGKCRQGNAKRFSFKSDYLHPWVQGKPSDHSFRFPGRWILNFEACCLTLPWILNSDASDSLARLRYAYSIISPGDIRRPAGVHIVYRHDAPGGRRDGTTPIPET